MINRGDNLAVTIVIPTFNRFNFLCNAIRSALEQTADVDVIVVDHGSSDETARIPQMFGDRIRFIRREFDSGPHFSWLDGCLAAQTPFIKLLFDDDFLEPTFIEKTMGLFSPSVGFVFSRATITDADGRPETELFKGLLSGSGVFYKISDRRAVKTPVVSPSAAVFRREDLIDSLFIDKMPLQERNYHGVGPDHFVKFLALMRYRGFGFVDEPLVNFRSHPGSITVASGADFSSNKLKAAYSEVENIAFILSAIKKSNLVGLLRLTIPIRRSSRGLSKKWRRLVRQIRRHGLVPVRMQTDIEPGAR
jgi:glycosyltransferase involved in cell wall biosynthesis